MTLDDVHAQEDTYFVCISFKASRSLANHQKYHQFLLKEEKISDKMVY